MGTGIQILLFAVLYPACLLSLGCVSSPFTGLSDLAFAHLSRPFMVAPCLHLFPFKKESLNASGLGSWELRGFGPRDQLHRSVKEGNLSVYSQWTPPPTLYLHWL